MADGAEVSRGRMAAMLVANDKLLKALVILLSLKDEHLLTELRTVVAHMKRESPEMAAGPDAAWEHLRHEMELIAELVEGEGASDSDLH